MKTKKRRVRKMNGRIRYGVPIPKYERGGKWKDIALTMKKDGTYDVRTRIEAQALAGAIKRTGGRATVRTLKTGGYGVWRIK